LTGELTTQSTGFLAGTTGEKAPPSAPEFPRAYPRELIRKVVNAGFGEATGFIAVRYGSKARGLEGRDEDYLVLVFSKASETSPLTVQLAHSDHTWKEHDIAVDLTFREFHSFVFGLILGRPYEHSVVEVAQIVDSREVPRSYWSWLQSLANNILIDTVTLRRHLLEVDLATAMELFRTGKDVSDIGQVCIGAYSASSILLQAKALALSSKCLTTEDVCKLSQVDELRRHIQDTRLQSDFDVVVSAAKRFVSPADPLAFVKMSEALINALKE
jgi:hypothetical protein